MNTGNLNSNLPLSCQLILVCMVLSLSACANKAALRDKKRAHYENLESELLNEQKTKDRQQRDEYRVGPGMQPSDSVAVSPTKPHTANDRFSTDDLVIGTIESLENLTNTEPDTTTRNSITGSRQPEVIAIPAKNSLPDIPAPVVKQTAVGQTLEAASNRNWRRQNYPSPIDGSLLCAIVSIPMAVQNGELTTQVNIVVSEDTVFLRTDSTFDTGALDTGFQIDAGFPIPFDRYLNELTAVIDENYPVVLSGLKNGTTLSVSFAYDPQFSATDTHVVELTLESFGHAWSEMTQCSVELDG